jgi:hypothetical protein
MGDHKVKRVYYEVFIMTFCISLFIHAYYNKTIKNSLELGNILQTSVTLSRILFELTC